MCVCVWVDRGAVCGTAPRLLEVSRTSNNHHHTHTQTDSYPQTPVEALLEEVEEVVGGARTVKNTRAL